MQSSRLIIAKRFSVSAAPDLSLHKKLINTRDTLLFYVHQAISICTYTYSTSVIYRWVQQEKVNLSAYLSLKLIHFFPNPSNFIVPHSNRSFIVYRIRTEIYHRSWWCSVDVHAWIKVSFQIFGRQVNIEYNILLFNSNLQISFRIYKQS